MMPAEFPAALGFDGAGDVEQIGAGVTMFRPGDAVFGQFMPRVLHYGTYADYVVASAAGAVAPKPESLDYVQAAALPMPAATALSCIDALDLGPGSTLLIVGATGGVGSYAIQFAAQRGAHVLATARPDATAQVTALGAAEALDYTQGDLATMARTRYPGGIDAVLDLATTEPAGLAHISEVLGKGGRLISTIESAQAPTLVGRGIAASNLSWQPSAALLDRIVRLVDAGKLKVVIDRIYPLEQVADALEQLEHGQVHGKVVLQIA
jgi:NADPH:quinone reductase-like Zn-dependent oxidoreductase